MKINTKYVITAPSNEEIALFNLLVKIKMRTNKKHPKMRIALIIKSFNYFVN